MESTFENIELELSHLIKSYNSMHNELENFKKEFTEISLRVVPITKEKKTDTKLNSDRLDQELKTFGQLLNQMKTSFAEIRSEYGKLENPYVELGEEVNRMMAKRNLNSNILTPSQTKDLIDLIEFSSSIKWRLLYSGSRDGFGARDFHSRCDGKPGTLTIIKSTNGNIFGGYSDAEWDGSGQFKKDPNAFLFSLINLLEKPLKLKCKISSFGNPSVSDYFAIKCDSKCGPVFGNSDLKIMDKSDLSDSNSALGYSFCNYSQDLLAGSKDFKVLDIEVFERVKKSEFVFFK